MPIDGMTQADEVARRLYDFETILDEAVAAGAALLGSVPLARVEQRLSAVVGQPVYSHLTQALAAVSEARGHTVQAHRHVERVAAQNAIEVRAWGDTQPKPPNPKFFAGAEGEFEPVA